PDDELLSEYLLSELAKQNKLYEYEEVAKNIIKQLRLKEDTYYSNHYDLILKDEYNVAVLFPFDFDSLEGAGKVARNRVIMDMYEGIKFAAEELNNSGRKINIYPYDTKGNKSSLHETEEILKREELLGMDLIIGPRYRQPFNMVFEFSKQNKINMINPWSSNSQVTGDNLFSFLLNPSEKTQALKLAEYAIENFENKNAFVFYHARDSLLAAIYKNELEENGFSVPVFNEVNQE
ncbi:MAG: ABC transporter substrate-binding protein, partial [Bacteroidota bacterium]